MRKKRILTEEHKRKISESQRGKKKVFSLQAIENIRKAAAKRRGIPTGPRSEEIKKKISLATTGVKKTITSPNPTWFAKGHVPTNGFEKGNTPWNKGRKASQKIRAILKAIAEKRHANACGRRCWKAKEWAKKVMDRDNNECQECFSKKGLVAHHIKPWKEFAELRFDISNGLTLCNRCHSRLHGKESCNLPYDPNLNIGRIPWSKGKKFSAEHRKKLSDAHKGQKAWNKGLKGGVAPIGAFKKGNIPWNKGLKIRKES